MAQLEHLPLPRVEGELDRRKKKGYFEPLNRNVSAHAAALDTKLAAIKAGTPVAPAGAPQPPLLIQVKTKGIVDPDNWPRVDMQIVSTDPNSTVVLFAADSELAKFRT